jgi:hypothetical protein
VTTLPLVRRFDSLPEYTTYRDTGCSLNPKCLECPFAVCRFDDAFYGAIRDARDTSIRNMLAAGADVDMVAKTFGLSRRSVFRVKAAAR